MKNILFVLIFISLKGFGQFPDKQSLASPTTRIEFRGAVHAVKGLINGRYADTTAANSGHIDFYNGAQIFTTSDKILWLRDSVLNKWVQASIVSANNGLSLSGTTVQLGQTIYQSGNPAAFTANREIPIGDYALSLNNRTGTYTGSDSSSIKFTTTIGGGGIDLRGRHGGVISFYPNSLNVYPGINFYNHTGTLQGSYGMHYQSGAASDKHIWLADMRDSTRFASVEANGATLAFFWTGFANNYLTQLGVLGRTSFGATGLANNLILGDVDNFGSTYLRDSLSLAWTPASSSSTDSVLVKSGLLIKARAQGSIAGVTGGIDDVLTVGQVFTNGRTMDINVHTLDISGSGTQIFIDNPNEYIRLSAGDDLRLDAPDVKIVQDPTLVYDTTNYKPIVRNITDGKLYRTYWPTGTGGSQTLQQAFATQGNTATMTGDNVTDVGGFSYSILAGTTPGSNAGLTVDEAGNRITIAGNTGNINFDLFTATGQTRVSNNNGVGVTAYPADSLIIGQYTTNKKRLKVTPDSIMIKNLVHSGNGADVMVVVDSLTGEINHRPIGIADLSYETISYSASLSVTYDALRPNKKITFGAGNLAITNTSTVNGSSGIYKVVQDGTGSRTLTINGTAITIRTAAGSATLVGWIYDGSDYDFDTNL